MRDTKAVLKQLESHREVLNNMSLFRYSCNDLYGFVSEIILFLKNSGIENSNKGDSCQNQLADAISEISPSAKYGLKNKKSLSKFENVKKDVLWFLDHFIDKIKRDIAIQ